jgi:hypothetical protein
LKSKTLPVILLAAGFLLRLTLGCLAVAFWLLKTHVLKVKARGMPQWIADSYLRTSVFQPGVDKPIPFALRANVRFFHYLFARTGVGILGLLLFAFGIFLLAKSRHAKVDSRLPSQPVLALFLVLPFVINCGLALAGVYHYGGSRHNSYLAIFAINSHVHTMVTGGGLHGSSNIWVSRVYYELDLLMEAWRKALIALLRAAVRAGQLRTELTADQMEDLLTHLGRCWWSIEIQSFEDKGHFLQYAGRYISKRPPETVWTRM